MNMLSTMRSSFNAENTGGAGGKFRKKEEASAIAKSILLDSERLDKLKKGLKWAVKELNGREWKFRPSNLSKLPGALERLKDQNSKRQNADLKIVADVATLLNFIATNTEVDLYLINDGTMLEVRGLVGELYGKVAELKWHSENGSKFSQKLDDIVEQITEAFEAD